MSHTYHITRTPLFIPSYTTAEAYYSNMYCKVPSLIVPSCLITVISYYVFLIVVLYYNQRKKSTRYQNINITSCFDENEYGDDTSSLPSCCTCCEEEAETNETSNISKCVEESEIEESSCNQFYNQLIQRDNVLIQTAIEIIHSWILAYSTPLLSTLTNPIMIYKSDILFSRSILVELLSVYRVERLFLLINPLYDNKSKYGNSSSLAESLATLILTSFGLRLDEDTIALLSTALCISRDVYIYDFVLLALTGKESIHSNIVFEIGNRKYTNIIDKLISECNRGHDLYKWIYGEPQSLMVFLRTFMSKPISATPILGSIDQFKSELVMVQKQFSVFYEGLRIFKEDHLSTFGDAYNELLKYKSQYATTKDSIRHFIDSKFINNDAACSTYSQLEEIISSLHALLVHCKQTEDDIQMYESTLLFDQLCGLVYVCISETQACFNRIAATHIQSKTTIQKHAVDELNTVIDRNMNIVAALSHVLDIHGNFSYPSTEVSCKNELSNLKYSCMRLGDRYRNIEQAWKDALDIQFDLKFGLFMLNKLQLSDHCLLNYHVETLEEVQKINSNCFMDAYKRIDQMLINNITLNAATIDPSTAIVAQTIRVLREEANILKNSCVNTSLIIQKRNDKQQLEIKIADAHHWLQAFKTNILTAALVDYLWSPDYLRTSNDQQDKNSIDSLSALRDQLGQFTSTTYKQICAYYNRYSGDIMAPCYTNNENMIIQQHRDDEHQLLQEISKTYNVAVVVIKDNNLLDEYTWLYSLDSAYKEATSIFRFAIQIQQQKRNIISFVQHTHQHKLKIIQFQEEHLLQRNDTSENEMIAQQVVVLNQEAKVIFMDEYQLIGWPQLMYEDEVKTKFDNYYKSLYWEVDKIRKEFVRYCLQFTKSIQN